MLNEALEYLEDRKSSSPSFTYEIIIVDDGSKDATTETAIIYVEKFGSDKGQWKPEMASGLGAACLVRSPARIYFIEDCLGDFGSTGEIYHN